MRKSYIGLYGGVALAALGMASAPAMAQSADTAAATPAAAQTAPAAADQQTADADSAPGHDIIVVATKRAENVQKVPISMTVVGGEQLAQFHATDVKSVMAVTPNVFVEQTAGNDVVYIRGFGSPPSNFSFDQSVSMYMDGVYMGKVRQDLDPFFDVGHVEVLRGPQGALFGKNTAAGAINIVSAGPTDHMEASLTGLYNFSQPGYDITGYVSGPVTNTLSARFAVRLKDERSYIENLYDDSYPRDQQQDLRLTLRWAPSSTFDDTVKVEYENIKSPGGQSVSSPADTPQRPVLYRYMEPFDLGEEGNFNKSFLASNTANFHFGDYTLTSVTGYSWYDGSVVNGFDMDIPGTGFPPQHTLGNNVYNSYPEQFNQISQEVRLLSPTGRFFEYIVGAYYDSSDYHLQQFENFDIPNFLGYPEYFASQESLFGQTSHSESVFGQGTLHFAPWLRAIGSLRWTSTYKKAWYYDQQVYGPKPVQPVGASDQGSFTEDHLDPSGTIQIDLAPDVMFYATYGRGSKSGGFVSNTWGTTDGTNNTVDTFRYKPETSQNYEAGLKFTVLDRKLVGSVSVYDTKFKNLQVSTYNNSTNGYVTGNAASATSKGVEASVALYPVHNFDITANGAYMDIKYDDFLGATCLATQTDCDPVTNNLAGYTPPYTSKWTGSVQAHARFDLNDMKLDVTGVAAGRSGYYDSDDQSPLYGYQKGYIKYDARIQLSSQNDSWHVALVGKNLSNKLTTGSAFLLTFITEATRALTYIEPPRSISLELGFKY
jgi:iron complex outermembrane recepter protein